MNKQCNDCEYWVPQSTMIPVVTDEGDRLWLCIHCYRLMVLMADEDNQPVQG